MVSTRQASKSQQRTEEDSLPAASGDGYEERTPESNNTRGKKRVKTTDITVEEKEAAKRLKKAKLRRLPEMPIDILYEVRESFRFTCSLL